MNAQLNKLIQQCVASQLNKDPYNKQRNKLLKKKKKKEVPSRLKTTLKQRSEFKNYYKFNLHSTKTKQIIN